MKKTQLTVLFLFVLHTAVVSADKSDVVINTTGFITNMNSNVFVFKNNACKFDVYEVEYKTFENFSTSENIQSDCLWYKITIQNNTNTNTQIILFSGNNDYVDLYIKAPNKTFTHYKAGQFCSFAERSFSKGKDSKFLLNFGASENKTLFIQMRNISGKPLINNFRIQPYQQFISEHNKNNFLIIVFVVLLLVGVFYALLSFFIHKQIISVYYALFLVGELLFLLVYSTIIFEFILVDIQLDSLLYMYLLHQSLGLFYTLFSRELITKNRFPFLDKLLLISVFIKFLWGIIQLAIYLIFNEIVLMEKINLGVYLVDGVFAFYIIVKVFDKQNTITNLFILGTFILVAFQILALVSFIISASISPLIAHEIGVIGQLFVLSIGLSLRLKNNLAPQKHINAGLDITPIYSEKAPKTQLRAQKYQTSKLQDNAKHELWNIIIEQFEKNKIYLNHSLTLDKLARQVNSNTAYISQIIGEYSEQKHFNKFVNSYRINEACSILANPDNDIQIKNLFSEVGFKSKTTFYNAFKQATNMTPNEYRTHILG